MKRNFKEAVLNRRTYYSINNDIKVSDEEIKEAIEFALLHVPSSFNSQSARAVLLLKEDHLKLWNIVKSTLAKKISAEAFKATEEKINGSFASGYGTILFFEDEEVIDGLQNAFKSYADNFPLWSLQSSGMHQFAVWTMLEDMGLGASLQHYNPLIDEEVAKTWNINPKWKLISQMPFGNPTQKAGAKEHKPLDERFKIYG